MSPEVSILLNEKKHMATQKLTIAANLIALALVVNVFRWDINISGASVMRVSFGGPFIYFIPILFGPLYGGLAGAIVDVIGYLMRPESGPFNPLLTLTAFLAGFAVGLIWRGVKKVGFKIYNLIYLFTFFLFLILGVATLLSINFFPASSYSLFINNNFIQMTGPNRDVVTNNTNVLCFGFLAAGLFGLLAYVVGWFVIKRSNKGQHKDRFDYYLKLFVAIALPLLVMTTVNTAIIRVQYGMAGRFPFMYSLLPRFVETIPKVLYNIYGILILTAIYNKNIKSKS